MFSQKMFKFLFLIPLIALMMIFVAPTATFAHAASGGPGRHSQRVTAMSVTLCPDCQSKDPWGYLHNGLPCWVGAREVASTNIRGGKLSLLYSDACGTNWAVVEENTSGLIANANVTRADGVRYDGTRDQQNSLDPVWSPMVYAPVLAARACGSINNWPGGCTAWV